MEIGQKVKVSGTKLEGVIVNIDYRREGSSTAKAFYVVRLTNGTEHEYWFNELRKL